MEDKQAHSITIEDVAREAGVGLGTVSRVLNNHPSVSDSTRARVLEVVQNLNYHPNAQARRLVTGRAESVCFVLGNREIIDPFHARVLHGAQKFFATLGLQVVYLPFEYPDTSKLTLPWFIAGHGVVDGVILAGTNRRNLLDALDRVGIPYVVFGNNLVPEDSDAQDSVWFDDVDGGYQIGKHLISQGRKNVWYCGGTEHPWFSRRFEGCKKALNECGIDLHYGEKYIKSDNMHCGYESMLYLLETNQAVDAVFAGNDTIAYGIWKALSECGVRVPEDIAIVGFDDRELCLLTTPQISSVRTFNEEVGRECASMLLEKLKNPGSKMPKKVLPTELIIRGSSDSDFA